jgi:hypothetical protein
MVRTAATFNLEQGLTALKGTAFEEVQRSWSHYFNKGLHERCTSSKVVPVNVFINTAFSGGTSMSERFVAKCHIAFPERPICITT